MRTYFRWIVFWVTILAITLPMHLYAACQIVGTTPDGGYVVVCDGPDTIGYASGNGNDIITINVGADVTKTDVQSVDVTATANATTINAGGGNNQVTNNGSIGANAGANALPVGGSPSQAAADATGIGAKDGADVIQNFSAITSTATSNSTSGNISITLEGNKHSQSMTTSTADATGIAGAGGNNQMTNSGVITVTGTSQSEAPFIALNITDKAFADVSVTAAATGTGIFGQGSIVNQQTGTITVTVSSSAITGEFNANIGDSAKADATTKAEATATGIAGSGGKDTVTSAGTLAVSATSNAKGSVDLEISTDAEINATIEARSSATGIDGRGGDDTITNQSTLSATSTATAASDNINASIWAPGVTDTSVKSIAVSTGILSGSGKDMITNEGSITIYSEATTELSNVLLSGGIEVALHTDVKGGATSEATATGVDVGDGDDQITNNSTLNASSKASTSSEGVLLTPVGIGTFATPTTATARSTGIAGGAGKDEITNSGTITANATSSAEALSVTVSLLQYDVVSDGDAKTRSEVYATGIAGGDGDDKVTHTGTITANANTQASTTEISVEYVGAARGNSSTTSYAYATGIDGGTGIDEITNLGTITVSATSEVQALSIDVKRKGIPLKPAEWAGLELGDAKTAAQANAIGIEGGEGNDTITNSSTINVSANSTASSDQIAASLDISSTSSTSSTASVSTANLEGPTAAGITNAPLQATVGGEESIIGFGAEVTDAKTTAQTTATGISGNTGDDNIINNKVSVTGKAEADSLSLTASISVGKGGMTGILPGTALVDGSTTAEATVTGIDGGAGNDTISNTGELNSEAISNSTSASIGVFFKGVTQGSIAWGGAFSDTTTRAISTATGIAGGEGDDKITNSGKIKVTATPDADSASISLAIVGSEKEGGLVGGFTYVDATTTAQATVVGIDGGAGDDTITNAGEIEGTAESTSSSASIGVTAAGVKKGMGIAAALADGTTKAISSATGINSGDGDDTITSSGKIKAAANSDADSASVSVSIVGTKEGVVGGVSYADATTTAEAMATGIDTGVGNNVISVTGEIEVMANSTSSSASIGVTAVGVKEGGGIAIALTDGTTKAISDATGARGGGGNDTITNSGEIKISATSDADSASVSLSVAGTAEGAVAAVTYADATTTSNATAIGIDGGSGDDIIRNEQTLRVTSESTATSASIGVNVGGAVEGAAVGIALSNVETKAKSSSTGIEGGEGENTITNTGTIAVSAKSDVTAASVSVDFEATGTGVAGGASLANGDTTVEAYAIGINNGSGKGTIVNDNAISVNAESTSTLASISVAIHGTPEGISLGAALASASNTAKASAIGIQGGNDNDIIANTGTITVSATTSADTTSVALDAECAPVGLGASLAKTNTTAEAIATGLSGGSGDDEMTNTGTINANSSTAASSKAISVSIATASYSSADVSTTATAKSTGMDGGSGTDLLRNEGTIDLKATSNADGKAGSANLTGYAAADVDITAEATTTGIDGGAEYSNIDNLTNMGTIKTLSDATAKGLSVSVNLLGGVATDANTTARAITTGIKGGVGGDQILNQGNIDLTAKSNTDVLGVSVTLGGYSDSNAESKGESTATGINAGDGVNTIISKGSIKASSEAYADTASVSVNLLGYAAAKGGATASATAIGIASGKDADSIQNEGTIDLSALSDTHASAASVQLLGYGDSNARAISAPTVKGIDGGDGNNTIINISTGVITGTATAYADASSYDIQLAGGAKATAGTEAIATAIGIAGGKEMDTIRNEGTVNLTGQSTLVSESRSYKIFGVGFADADSMALAFATGIDGGDGANAIINASTGSITASSNASATATGMTANIGVAGSSASTTSKAHSTGIRSGGENTIINEGILNVSATSSTYAGSGDFSLIGLSFGDALTEAITDGIVAGGGNDVISNTGSITVGSVQDNDHPMAYSNVDSVSFSLFNISSATFGSRAQATGIIGGGGHDTILNTGTITVGDDNWMAKGRGYGFSGNFFEFFSLTSVGATAETISTGIEAGDGNDTILNDSSGVLTVKAASYATTEGAADTTTFGDPAAFASSTTKATATGISGGEGGDVIENKGKIDVDAYAWADAYSDSWVGWGSPRADSTADATATAVGISVGEGQNFITNSGVINVKALAETTPYANADSDVDTTDAEAASASEVIAYGIIAGSGDDVIKNQGKIIVEAIAEKATSNDQRTTAWTDEVAKVGTSKNDPGIRSSATATGISAGGGTNRITNDGSITVKATAAGDGYAFAESDAYDTQTIIWAVVEANATGIATGQGSSQIINNGVVQVSSIAYSEIYSDSDSVDDADATGGATVTAKAWGINASGNNTPITNTGALDVDANATAKGNSRADSGGDGYGTAIFEANSNADAIGISAGGGGTVLNETQAQITVDAKAMIDASANGDEFGTMGTSQENPGAIAVAKAVGIFMRIGNNRIVNDGSISVNAEGNINAGSRSVSTTRSTHTNTWAKAESTAIGLTVGQGNSSIINTGYLEVNAKAIASLNDPDSGWGTYWRSDSWYNADAKTGAYAYSYATGIEASADNSNNRVNTVITHSGTVTVTSVATARGNAAGDRGGDDYGSATTYAEASAEASGFVVGNGNKLVSIESSGTLEVKSAADTLAFSHGDSDSWSYAKSLGYAYGIKVGDNNKLVSIKNSEAMKVESTATSDTADDEPWRQSDASSNVYGINIGNSNSKIVNSGTLDIISKANAKLYTDEDTAVSTVSSAYATAISTGNGTNTISNASQIQVIATTESKPNGGNSNSTNTATSQATGIKTGSNSDTITLRTSALVNAAATATTFSYNGATNVSAIGIDAGDGANQITNQGTISMSGDATSEVRRDSIFGFSITYPATAVSNSIGIKSGEGADIINNYGRIMVNSGAGAVINQVLDLSAGTKSATANAIGIDAGNGDNSVANYGTIDVSALAAAGTGANPNARTDGVESTTAIGIKTGDGSDRITNSGQITATQTRLEYVGGGEIHFINWPGIAISSGAGNDTVILTEGSQVNGDIDLGDGDDKLKFVGTATINGAIIPGAGSNSLIFEGTGNLSYNFEGFENTIKQGPGTFTLASLPTMKSIKVDGGTLEINSNYQFASDGTLAIQISRRDYGQIKINGQAELNGNLVVIAIKNRPYRNRQTFDILTANDMVNEFSTVNLPSPKPLLSFDLHYMDNPDRVQVEAHTKRFVKIVTNGSEESIGNYLDRISPSATDDLSGVLGEMQNLPESEFKTAFSSLSSDSYDNYTRATYNSNWQYTKSLQRRMNAIRSFGMTSVNHVESKPLLLAFAGSDASLGQLFAGDRLSQTQAKNGLWLNGYGQWGDQAADKGFTGFDYHIYGGTLGFDHAFGNKLIAGVSLGYSRTDVDLDHNEGNGNIKNLTGSLYGSYYTKNAYIEGALSYGKNWYDNHRNILIGSIERKADSDHDGDAFSAYLGGGYYFDLKDWALGPFASLRYVYLDEESFREKGADSLNLSVASRKTGSLVSELGLRVARSFRTKYGNLIPEVSAAWSYDFDIDNRLITTSFAGSPGAEFSIKGQPVERNGAVVGAGLTFIHGSGFSSSIRYSGEFREKYESHGVIGELRYTF